MKNKNLMSPSYWSRVKYVWMRSRCKNLSGYKNIEVKITLEEFQKFVDSQWSKILKMHNSGEFPSIDRIDSKKHYQLDNIQIVPLSRNLGKELRKPIRGTAISDGKVIMFESIAAAIRTRKFTHSKIIAALQGRQGHHKGYIWEYVK